METNMRLSGSDRTSFPKPYRTDTELVIACHGQTTRTVKLTKFAELCECLQVMAGLHIRMFNQ